MSGARFLVSLVDADGRPAPGFDCAESTRAAADERAYATINDFTRRVALKHGRGWHARILKVGDDGKIRLVGIVRRPDDTGPLVGPGEPEV